MKLLSFNKPVGRGWRVELRSRWLFGNRTWHIRPQLDVMKLNPKRNIGHARGILILGNFHRFQFDLCAYKLP